MRKRTTVGAFVLWVALAPTTAAESPKIGDRATLAAAIESRFAESREWQARSSWKERSEIRKKGDVVFRSLELVRFTTDGALEKSEIEEPEQAGTKGERPKSPPAKKARAWREWGSRVGELLDEYALAAPGEVHDFVVKARVGLGDIAGTLRIRRRDVVQPGDELTLWFDAATRRLRRTRIATRLDGAPVAAEILYRPGDGGIALETRRIVEVPAEQIVMIVETLDRSVTASESP